MIDHAYLPWIGAGIISVGMLVLWVLERRWRNASHVDAGWSAGIGILAIGYAIFSEGDPWRRGIVATMVGIWALRLTWHLIADRLGNRPEDGRYAALRKKWAPHSGLWFLLFFQLQAFFVVVFSLPAWVIVAKVTSFGGWTDIVGIMWFLVALVGLVSADRQLARWRADPTHHGRTCRAGLWAYSRHPNYFFEFLLWWSYAWLGWGADQAWLTIAVPLFLLALLQFVTGIPYTEKQAIASRGDDYRAYQREVSRFIPWFPRRSRSEESP